MSEKEKKTISPQDLVFQKDVYEKGKKLFQLAEKHLGIRLFVHAEEDTLKDGQIFLFNHFTRFETVIPGYIFYQRFGAFTRTITDHDLFRLNPRLDAFLFGAGAVPNNLPGLLPFLAAELLRGRRVVIFPEGKMIKDRKVMNSEGSFQLFSDNGTVYREHHRGAAVLALTVELFKRRIKGLFESGDTPRLQRWCKALEYADLDELQQRVHKPTLIVPGTITFNPLRVGTNILFRAINLLDRDIPDSLLEELIVEGNILLKDTDMDIRFGKPLTIEPKWNWWQKRILNSYFLSITSLDELFSLRDSAETWSQRLLTSLIYKETVKIRDDYIKKIYQGLTVNISHLASVLVYAYLEKGEMRIPKQEFHNALYLAVKELQTKPDIHLSRFLAKPENYRARSVEGNIMFRQFLHTAAFTQLVNEEQDYYVLQDKLKEKSNFQSIRRENPLQVSVNEASPVEEIGIAINTSLASAKNYDASVLAALLWDDELRAFAWEKEKFTTEKYSTINHNEEEYRQNGPFLFCEQGTTRTGVLLVHGFLASPAEVLAYGEHIRDKGFNVLGVRLAGHGTSPADLNARDWEEWLESVRGSYEILTAFCEQVIIVGFSVGGTLALLLASEKPAQLNSIVTVCAALEVQNKGIMFSSAMNAINSFVRIFPRVDGLMNYKRSNTRHVVTNYRNMPVRALSELGRMLKVTRRKLADVTVPVLVIQSDADDVVDPESAKDIMDGIGSSDKTLIMLEAASHDLLRNNIENTWELIDDFLEKQTRLMDNEKDS